MSLGIIGLLKKKLFVLGIFGIALCLTFINLSSATSFLYLAPYEMCVLFAYFAFGMLAYLYRDRLQLRIEIFLLILILLLASTVTNFQISEGLFIFPLAYLVLFLGYSPTIKIKWFTKFGDFSYGIYIIGFPVQQGIIQLTQGKISPEHLFAISLPITYLLAALSWHLIEKRMLRLKTKYFDLPVINNKEVSSVSPTDQMK
jgi:peptidoglycan/LPS O-acetylase OafA/YrhL